MLANFKISFDFRGLIDQFDGVNINIQMAANAIADELVKKGMFEDAIKMYDLGSVSSFLTLLFAFLLNVRFSTRRIKNKLFVTS